MKARTAGSTLSGCCSSNERRLSHAAGRRAVVLLDRSSQGSQVISMRRLAATKSPRAARVANHAAGAPRADNTAESRKHVAASSTTPPPSPILLHRTLPFVALFFQSHSVTTLIFQKTPFWLFFSQRGGPPAACLPYPESGSLPLPTSRQPLESFVTPSKINIPPAATFRCIRLLVLSL